MTVLTTAQALASHARTYRGGDAGDALRTARGVVEAAIVGQPRSQQRVIGPSELGTPCLLCLGRKLAGIPQRRDAAWLPYVGTAVHAQLEDVFLEHNRTRAADDGQDWRYLPESRVHVGDVDGQQIWGTCDLFDVHTGTVIDFKVVGVTTLRSARAHGASQTYQVQASLYGLGWQRAGYRVEHVAIWYLPRNEPRIDGGVVWTVSFDPAPGLAALARADALAKAIRLLGADDVLEDLTPTPGCLSCTHYADGRGGTPIAPLPGHRAAPDLEGLLLATPPPGARAPAPVT